MTYNNLLTIFLNSLPPYMSKLKLILNQLSDESGTTLIKELSTLLKTFQGAGNSTKDSNYIHLIREFKLPDLINSHVCHLHSYSFHGL